MVHLGFEVDLTFILDALPSETMSGEDQGDQMDVDGETLVKKGRTRVTTLFSATMPPAVERLARKYLKKPAVITIGEAGRAVDTVEQRVEFVNGEEKKKYVASFQTLPKQMLTSMFPIRQKLLEVLNSGQFPSPIIVFVNQKKTADMVAKDLSRAGVGFLALLSIDSELIYTLFSVVERSDFAFGQKSRTERSIIAIAAQWRLGCTRCN